MSAVLAGLVLGAAAMGWDEDALVAALAKTGLTLYAAVELTRAEIRDGHVVTAGCALGDGSGAVDRARMRALGKAAETAGTVFVGGTEHAVAADYGSEIGRKGLLMIASNVRLLEVVAVGQGASRTTCVVLQGNG
jgi:hypothetical protein